MSGIDLYRRMALSRAFELVVASLWYRGLISGEMHLGTGEEAVHAGLAAHLLDGDAVALDHRATPMMVMRGVPLTALLQEMLGLAGGLGRGRGGHMHLFSKDHLAASSGIVGAAAPLAVGFALANRQLRPGRVALAFFGDGAMNQGQVLEALNLAAAWHLPVLFVCKDNHWAITTESAAVTGGDLLERARAFGLTAARVDGLDPEAVQRTGGELLGGLRRGEGPAFLLATCSRLRGHFLGDVTFRLTEHPVSEGGPVIRQVAAALFSRGDGAAGRAESVRAMMKVLARVRRERHDRHLDPIHLAREALSDREAELDAVDEAVAREVQAALDAVREAIPWPD